MDLFLQKAPFCSFKGILPVWKIWVRNTFLFNLVYKDAPILHYLCAWWHNLVVAWAAHLLGDILGLLVILLV